MGTLYVAGQHPGAGATAVATALATVWKQAGRSVAVVKPVTLTENGDGGLYARTFGSPNDPSIVLNAEEQDAAFDEAVKRVDALADEMDVVIVEGLPYADDEGYPVTASQALAERLGASVLGVLPYDRALDARTASKWLTTYASLLVGVVINRRSRYGAHDASTRLAPAFEDAGVSVLGILPEERQLLAPTVRQVVDLLDGTFYAGTSGQGDLVENFLIGGLITEWGGNYFGRLPHQAVLVRGGRTDIQMAALNFPLKCLLLTGCEKPPQYVHQRATDLDVPLVTMSHDTHSAAAILERIQDQVTVDHPDKIALLAGIVGSVVDLATLEEAAGLPAT